MVSILVELNMNIMKFVLLCLSCVSILSCDNGSKAGEKLPPAKQSDQARNCIPEAELMAGGITGGTLVKQGDNDAKTVMMVVSNGELCTASAISDRVLLTAAHCVATGKKENTFAAFYASLSCESGFNRNTNSIGVTKIVVHEDYNSGVEADVTSGDIALVFLDSKIPEGYPIYKIADPDKVIEDALIMYGYGRTGSKLGGAGMLRKTLIASTSYKIQRDDKKINVTQSNGIGICQGDSGGPSLVMIEGEAQILGINSYVVGSKDDICGNQSYETLVAPYTDWIKARLAEVPAPPANR